MCIKEFNGQTMDENFNLNNIDRTFVRFRVGAKVEAVAVAEMKSGLLVNIGGKKDGLIPYLPEELEALKDVEVGDKFEAIITNTKDESGAVLLSKAKADEIRRGEQMINNLQVGDEVEIIITHAVHGGLQSKLGNFEVFVPYSQISIRRVDNNLENYVNKQLKAIIIEIDLLNKKIIASIKAVEENEKHTRETAFWEAMYLDKIVKGKVVRFTDFGAFVNVDGIDCLVHNSESSYDKNKVASDVFEIGKEYEFKVIKCDKEQGKVSLSYKALQPNPTIEKLKQYHVGDIVHCTVKKILSFGALVTFGDGLEGLLHVKEASHYYVRNIYEVAKVGEELDLKIIALDPEKCKVSLSLKATQEEPEIVKLARNRDGSMTFNFDRENENK